MPKKEDAKKILSTLNMPTAQQSDIASYTLLALSSVTEESSWSSATNEWHRIYDIMQFTGTSYRTTYAPNTRETFRKQALHHFRNAAMIEDNGLATNSPNYSYRLTDEFLALIKSFRTEKWNDSINNYFERHPSLIELYSSKKKMSKMPVLVNNAQILFSTGIHNVLQKKILEEFAPRFAPFSECFYIGDTEVWIADLPEHIIHMDGDRFLGPR